MRFHWSCITLYCISTTLSGYIPLNIKSAQTLVAELEGSWYLQGSYWGQRMTLYALGCYAILAVFGTLIPYREKEARANCQPALPCPNAEGLLFFCRWRGRSYRTSAGGGRPRARGREAQHGRSRLCFLMWLKGDTWHWTRVGYSSFLLLLGDEQSSLSRKKETVY